MTPSNADRDSSPAAEAASAGARSAPRPFCWSVRRELWENRSLYVAPLIAAGVVLFGSAMSTMFAAERMRAISVPDPARQGAMIAAGFDFAAFVIVVTGVIVGAFYCLGALHNERRDRSILFWKSLPVSDPTTVLAKASVPMLILPVIVFGVVVAMQLVMLLLGAVILPMHGVSAANLWAHAPVLRDLPGLAYALIALALWYAPIWGWLLLVSGWARRAPFLWAVLPPLALCIVEKIAFDTTSLFSLLKYRLGGFTEAFTVNGPGGGPFGAPQPDPMGFLGTPGLWEGLAVAAAFLAAAVWQRRYREPT
ncbi:MAG: hypothetical protein ACR2F8_14020 [Caulobacteraceae bacterium]